MSLDHAIAAPAVATIAGREVKLSPLTLESYGIVVRHLKSLAYDPLPAARQIAASLPLAEAEATIRDAIAERRRSLDGITIDDAIAFLFSGSFDGLSFAIWLSVPGEFTRQQLYMWLLEMKRSNRDSEVTNISQTILELAGLAAQKNSTTPAG